MILNNTTLSRTHALFSSTIQAREASPSLLRLRRAISLILGERRLLTHYSSTTLFLNSTYFCTFDTMLRLSVGLKYSKGCQCIRSLKTQIYTLMATIPVSSNC